MSVCFRKARAHRNVDASGGIELQFYSYKGTQLLEKAEHVEEAISYHPSCSTSVSVLSKEIHWLRLLPKSHTGVILLYRPPCPHLCQLQLGIFESISLQSRYPLGCTSRRRVFNQAASLIQKRV